MSVGERGRLGRRIRVEGDPVGQEPRPPQVRDGIDIRAVAGVDIEMPAERSGGLVRDDGYGAVAGGDVQQPGAALKRLEESPPHILQWLWVPYGLGRQRAHEPWPMP